jgi:hypothetical protein
LRWGKVQNGSQCRQNSQNWEGLENKHKKKAGAEEQTLAGFTSKINWQQTNREHRHKYTGDNGEDG